MRVVMILCLLLAPLSAMAASAKTAVFDLEILDMSQEGAGSPRADETRRAALASAELRTLLASSSQIEVIDTAPQAEAIRARGPLFKCNSCEVDIAKALGADLSVSGMVQKTSNLILSFLVTVKDVRSGKTIRAGQVDIRGNTDETWLRGVRWLVKNRLLAEPLPIPS